VGNAIGSLFIELAQADMRQHLANLPDKDLAYFKEGSRHFSADVFVTRKGAVSARVGKLGIIPGSMGAQRSLVAVVHTLRQVVCVKG
jgi:tRNA-splicing ligase RtcB (3'-phosphate/5'-hydroxy nucleic acid ligase)